jgi:hypothetical protein
MVRKFGYEIRPVGTGKKYLDLKVLESHPGSVHYFLRYNNYYVSMPLERARIVTTPLADYHYTLAARAAAEAGGIHEYDALKEKLTYLYRHGNFPETSSGRLGLEKGEVPELDNEPAYLRYFPWESESVDEKKKALFHWVNKHETGLTRDEYGENYSDEDAMEFDCKRLFSLYQSIKTKGYIIDFTPNEDIASQILINDNLDYRWVITGGHHRSAVCHALGYRDLESRIQNIIFRSEAVNWPGVVSGVFSKDAALKVFDSVFQ